MSTFEFSLAPEIVLYKNLLFFKANLSYSPLSIVNKNLK